MKTASIRFLLTMAIVTAFCAVLQLVWNEQGPEHFHLSNGFLLLGIFSLSNTLIHLFLLHSAKGDPKSFVRKYMVSSVFKFMFYILLLVALMFFTAEPKAAIVLYFLFYYTVFTILEISFLYSELRKP